MKYCKNGFQLLPIITKHSILDVAAALDPHLSLFCLSVSRNIRLYLIFDHHDLSYAIQSQRHLLNNQRQPEH